MHNLRKEYLRLALEILHYIQKPVVHVGLFNEADLDLIEIAQGILSITWLVATVYRNIIQKLNGLHSH